MNSCKVEPQMNQPREVIASEIMELLDMLAVSAEKTAARATEKLYPICLPDSPPPGCDATGAREYPPLFNDIREKLESIGSSIGRINNVLDRAEI